jgi:hypothetical protein
MADFFLLGAYGEETICLLAMTTVGTWVEK